MASSRDVKSRTSELVRLGFSVRLYGLSVIVLTKQLISISKPFRENWSKLISFYPPSKKDTDTLFDDCLSTVSKKERDEIVNTLKNNDFARNEVLLRRPYVHKVVVP